MNTTTQAKPHAGLSFALDFGPLLAFFIAYKFTGIFMGTAVFMAAIVVALVVSVIVLKRVSPMTWISAILVVGFGGLTISLNDPRLIQLKPTLISAGFPVLLFAGLPAPRPPLPQLFRPADRRVGAKDVS